MMVCNRTTLRLALVMGLMWGLASTAGAAEMPADFAIETTEEAIAWFPERSDISAVRPPAQPETSFTGDSTSAREAALIPLPPAAWTGLAGLVALTIPGMRRYLLHVIR